MVKARQIMAHDGVVCLVFKIDAQSRELVGNIQIESRGFVYSSEVKHIHTSVVEFAKQKYYEKLKQKKEIKDIMKIIKDDMSEYVTREVGRQPMIIPMYVYISRDGT